MAKYDREATTGSKRTS